MVDYVYGISSNYSFSFHHVIAVHFIFMINVDALSVLFVKVDISVISIVNVILFLRYFSN